MAQCDPVSLAAYPSLRHLATASSSPGHRIWLVLKEDSLIKFSILRICLVNFYLETCGFCFFSALVVASFSLSKRSMMSCVNVDEHRLVVAILRVINRMETSMESTGRDQQQLQSDFHVFLTFVHITGYNNKGRTATKMANFIGKLCPVARLLTLNLFQRSIGLSAISRVKESECW